jgi:hypothetical protein
VVTVVVVVVVAVVVAVVVELVAILTVCTMNYVRSHHELCQTLKATPQLVAS